jgi:hypothetical protein
MSSAFCRTSHRPEHKWLLRHYRKVMVIAVRRAKTIASEGHRSITLLRNLAGPDLAGFSLTDSLGFRR